MQNLFILVITLVLWGCGANQKSLETYDKSSRMDQGLVSRYQQTHSPTEEYVTRVAKRVMLVKDRPDSNYTFNILDTNDPVLTIDHESHTIAISHGVLIQLHDEAELAATLTLSMARLDNAPNIDRETAITLSKAGYDPQALLDLEQQYFYAAKDNDQHWMHTIFPFPPTAGSISANKVMLEKMPKGLLRNKEDYKKYING